jgi:hypothetical protein
MLAELKISVIGTSFAWVGAERKHCPAGVNNARSVALGSEIAVNNRRGEKWWWRGGDLNSRPIDYESIALTN